MNGMNGNVEAEATSNSPVTNSEINGVVSDFIGFSKDVMRKRKEFDECKKMVDKFIESVKEDGKFLDFVIKKVSENAFILREVSRIIDDYEGVEAKFRKDVLEIFKVVFSGAVSRTIVLLDRVDDVSLPITIGKNGFSLRPHIRSRPLYDFKDLKYILENKDKLITSLKTNNMFVEAKMFGKFCDVLKDYKGEYKSLWGGVNLSKHIFMPDSVLKSMYFSRNRMVFSRDFYSDSYESVTFYGDFTIYYDDILDTEFINILTAFAYMQVHDDLGKYFDHFKSRISPEFEKFKNMSSLLRSEFQRQLFAHEL